jgi:hypothetical protein
MNRLIGWCSLAALAGLPGLARAEAFTGTWNGTFAIHFADGRVENDKAWLVLQQTGAAVTGTAGPADDKQAPIRDGAVSGNTLRFVADSTPGKTLQFVLKRDGESLAGEAQGDIGENRVRVVVNATRLTTGATAGPDALHEKMLALDTAFFDSFNKCADPAEFRKHAAYFAPDVEFYHDLGGVTLGVDKLMDQTRRNVCGKFRRELDVASFRVFPIPGYGAMTLGVHRFCHTPATCEGAGDFATVWRESNGQWQVTRALSYAHRSLEAPAASN